MTDNEALLKLDDLDLHQIHDLWKGINVDYVGRILRAHLVVEHLMNEHIQQRIPDLDLRNPKLRLEFAQKFVLLDRKDGLVELLLPGIWALNEIRNKFAHDPHFTLSAQDLKKLRPDATFFGGYLKAYKEREGIETESPVDVIEAFAEFASVCLRFDVVLEKKGKELERELAELERRERELEKRERELDAQRAVLRDLGFPEDE